MVTPTGWSDEVFQRMMHRSGIAAGCPHRVPNYETAVYHGERVWGSYTITADAHLQFEDVRAPADQGGLGISALTPIDVAWRAVHRWCRAKGYQFGFLTYEASHVPDGTTIFGVLHEPAGSNNASVLDKSVPRAELVSQPGFNQPGLVMRDINRWAVARGFVWGWPTFEQSIENGDVVYGAHVVKKVDPAIPAFAFWQDIPDNLLRTPQPPPKPIATTANLVNTGNGQWTGGTASLPLPSNARISGVTVSPPSTWNATINLGFSGGGTATNIHVPPSGQLRHDFDGKSPQGQWTVTGTIHGGPGPLEDDTIGLGIQLAYS